MATYPRVACLLASFPKHRVASARYYRDVELRRLITLSALLSLAMATGCDRGSRPSYTGERAPDFTLSDGENSIHLANYRGKVVLLNFWASWCPPCVQETPALVELHHTRPDLAILAVSIDEDPDAYKRFLKRFNVDLTTVRDPNRTTANLYHTTGWPETYIIDRQGFIRRKIVGDPDWSSPEIREYLKSL